MSSGSPWEECTWPRPRRRTPGVEKVSATGSPSRSGHCKWSPFPLPSLGSTPAHSRESDRGDCPVGQPETWRSEEHTSELQSLTNLVCRLLLEKKKKKKTRLIATNKTK